MDKRQELFTYFLNTMATGPMIIKTLLLKVAFGRVMILTVTGS
jgi:hypothetical protein